jgi:NADH dehydrogenase/NADH:ubiquinone oxidoreductase subunit G
LQTQSPVHVQIQRALSEYETERIRKWREDVAAKAVEFIGFDEVDRDSPSRNEGVLDRTQEEVKSLMQRCEARRQKLRDSLEHQQKLRQLELDQEDKQIEANKQFEEEKRRAEVEKEQAEKDAAVAKLQEEEMRRKQKLDDEAQLKEKEAAVAAETQRVQEEIKVQEQELQRLQEQTQQHQIVVVTASASNEGVPPEFRRAVLQADLLTYAKLQQKLEEIKEAVKDISSSNPRTKEFYFAAMKVINTPINSISNLSSEHLQQKINHFIHLLGGKPVHIGDAMSKPFVASSK